MNPEEYQELLKARNEFKIYASHRRPGTSKRWRNISEIMRLKVKKAWASENNFKKLQLKKRINIFTKITKLGKALRRPSYDGEIKRFKNTPYKKHCSRLKSQKSETVFLSSFIFCKEKQLLKPNMNKLNKYYGHFAPSGSMVKKWFTEFRYSYTSTSDSSFWTSKRGFHIRNAHGYGFGRSII